MSDNAAASPFQIVDWRILAFNCANPLISIPSDIPHHWKLTAHIERAETENSFLRAFVQIQFSFEAENSGQKMYMNGQSIAICEMNKDSVPDAENVFQDLLLHTAMMNSLANLRVFLLQAGTLHSMGSKRTMLPFINLNNFPLDEEVSFTT